MKLRMPAPVKAYFRTKKAQRKARSLPYDGSLYSSISNGITSTHRYEPNRNLLTSIVDEKDGTTLSKNVTELYDASGAVATIYQYSPFGAVEASGSEPNLNPIQWSSEVYDSELGLVYYKAPEGFFCLGDWRNLRSNVCPKGESPMGWGRHYYRHYNPQDGRWINRDPIGIKGGLNLYGFIENRAWKIDRLGNGLTDWDDEKDWVNNSNCTDCLDYLNLEDSFDLAGQIVWLELIYPTSLKCIRNRDFLMIKMNSKPIPTTNPASNFTFGLGWGGNGNIHRGSILNLETGLDFDSNLNFHRYNGLWESLTAKIQTNLDFTLDFTNLDLRFSMKYNQPILNLNSDPSTTSVVADPNFNLTGSIEADLRGGGSFGGNIGVNLPYNYDSRKLGSGVIILGAKFTPNEVYGIPSPYKYSAAASFPTDKRNPTLTVEMSRMGDDWQGSISISSNFNDNHTISASFSQTSNFGFMNPVNWVKSIKNLFSTSNK